jgi:hypothetical protein
MNHRDRQTLGVTLDKLWDSRDGTGSQIGDRIGVMSNQQRELLAAAMRIVAGTPGPDLPDPWPTPNQLGEPRHGYTEPTRLRDRLLSWLSRT